MRKRKEKQTRKRSEQGTQQRKDEQGWKQEVVTKNSMERELYLEKAMPVRPAVCKDAVFGLVVKIFCCCYFFLPTINLISFVGKAFYYCALTKIKISIFFSKLSPHTWPFYLCLNSSDPLFSLEFLWTFPEKSPILHTWCSQCPGSSPSLLQYRYSQTYFKS